MKMIYQVGLSLSRECINLFAKWVLHTNHLDNADDPSLFNALEDKTSL